MGLYGNKSSDRNSIQIIRRINITLRKSTDITGALSYFEVIEHNMISKAIRNAEEKIEKKVLIINWSFHRKTG